MGKCLRTAMQFENETITRAPNSDLYTQAMRRKMAEISAKRSQNMGGVMNGNVAQMGNGQMQGDGTVNPNGAQMAQRGQQPPNMGNMQQQQMLNNMNQMGAPGMQPSMSQNSHQPQHMNNTPNPQMAPQFQPQELQEVAAKIMASIPDDKKAGLRNNIMRSMSEQDRQQASAAKKDPLINYVFKQARNELMARKAAQANGGQVPQNMMGNAGGANMAQAGSQQGNSFDFTAIMGQQANALKLQESGEQVVPASNNPNAQFKAPMNQPNAQAGNINPAMLGNGNGQGGNQMPNNMTQQQQMQIVLLQREKQRQEQMRNNAARNQAMQQAQMHGQGMGTQNALNGAAGGSPAMPMLNRPMQPPGSQTPNTPSQPNRAPNMQQPNQHGQTPGNGPNALMQHHQSMVNRNNSGVNMMQGPLAGLPHHPVFDNPQALNIIRTMPPPVIDKMRNIAQTSPEELPALIKQWALAQARRNQPNAQIGNQQMGNQGGMNGMPNGMPDINMQQAMMSQGQSQVPQGMDPAQLQARMQQQQQHQQQQQQHQQQQNPQQHQQQQQQPQQHQQQGQGQMQQQPQLPPNMMDRMPPAMKTQAMLSRPFPPQAASSLGLNVPPQVRIWGQLKLHIEQNQASLPPNIIQRFSAMITKWFHDNPAELEAGVRMIIATRQQQQQQQQQQMQGQNHNQGAHINGNNPTPMAMMQNSNQGGAPTAQMQPNAQMQQGQAGLQMNPAMNQMRMTPQNPIGPQEIAMFRQKVPQGASMSDDQIRKVIEQSRLRSMASQNQALKQAQLQNQLAQNQPINQQRPPSRTPGQPGNDQMQAQQQQAGQKRNQPQASNDDVVEIPNPNGQPAVAAQPNKARPTGPLAGMKLPNLTQEQLAKLGPQEREQLKRRYESLRQANAGARPVQAGMPPAPVAAAAPQQTESKPNETEADLRKTVQRMLEEVNRTQVKGPQVQQDATATENTITILKRIYGAYTQVDKTFTAALRLPEFDENRIKDIMKAKIQVFHNWDASTNGVKGYLSLSLRQVQYMQHLVQSYLQAMSQARARGQLNQQAAQQAQNQAQQQPTASQPAGPAPGMEKTASKHGRKASSSKPPPAPTDNKSFDWSVGVASPHGIPKYESGATQLTPDKLKFPPNKRRKTGQPESAGSTPAGQAGTPAGASPGVTAAKVVSPEQVRKAQLAREAEERDKKRWKCTKDAACEASIEGFETEEELKAHFDSVHSEIDDPLQFLLNSAAMSLDVDLEGKPLPGKAAADKPKPGARLLPPKAAAMKRDPSLTPAVKTEARTPAGQAITPATPGSGNKAAGAKAGDKQAVATDKTKSLQDSLAEKMGYETTSTADVNSNTASLSEEDQLWADISSTIASGLSTVEPFNFDTMTGGQIDDWGLRPEDGTVEGIQSSPETTPETDSQSSRSSDVSISDRLRINLEWDAFGNGDTAVPDMLNVAVSDLGLSASAGAGAAEKSDSEQQEQKDKDKPAADEKKDAAADKPVHAPVPSAVIDDLFDWSNDTNTSWDSLWLGQSDEDMQIDFSADANGPEMDFVF